MDVTAAGSEAPIDLLAEGRLLLTSVGVDIGSATTHLVFSSLRLEKVGSRYVTVERRVLYEAPVILTPFADATTIDGERLSLYVDEQYRLAGLRRDEVDTGALILTGIALGKRNARRLADVFAQEAGRLVAVSAGDSLEATMAAWGSGAVRIAQERELRLLHIDIGGGTTKLTICGPRGIEATAAIDVGARLLTVDAEGAVTRVEPPALLMAQLSGFEPVVGRRVEAAQIEQLSAVLADEVVGAALGPLADSGRLCRGPRLAYDHPIDAVTFSGGVAEYVYGREGQEFGDLGPSLARHCRSRIEESGVPILEVSSCIRATVVGASQYTVQVSGSTVFLSSSDVAPILNVPVVAPDFEVGERIDAANVARRVASSMALLDLVEKPGPLAIAYRWSGLATYARLREFAQGIVDGVQVRRDTTSPVVLVCDDDIAALVGQQVVENPGWSRPLISVDCVQLRHFDYIDVGAAVAGSHVVPIIVKSLEFLN